jgi:uncharacterized protein (TIGR03437 family)
MTATLPYAGLAPSLVGLDQFDLVVPDVAASNTAPLAFTWTVTWTVFRARKRFISLLRTDEP